MRYSRPACQPLPLTPVPPAMPTTLAVQAGTCSTNPTRYRGNLSPFSRYPPCYYGHTTCVVCLLPATPCQLVACHQCFPPLHRHPMMDHLERRAHHSRACSCYHCPPPPTAPRCPHCDMGIVPSRSQPKACLKCYLVPRTVQQAVHLLDYLTVVSCPIGQGERQGTELVRACTHRGPSLVCAHAPVPNPTHFAVTRVTIRGQACLLSTPQPPSSAGKTCTPTLFPLHRDHRRSPRRPSQFPRERAEHISRVLGQLPESSVLPSAHQCVAAMTPRHNQDPSFDEILCHTIPSLFSVLQCAPNFPPVV
jgi:hypothetical protein